MTVATPQTDRFAAPAAVDRLSKAGLAVGVVALVVCAIGFVVDWEQFLHSWLIGCTYWVGVSVGCLALLMIQALTGGSWGLVGRRVLEAGAGALPLVALLFLPILFGLEVLYPWSAADAGDDALLVHKAVWLNEPFFIGRFVAYFAIWFTLWFLLRRFSVRQETAGADAGRLNRRMAVVAAPGLVVWAFVTTFAYMDWLMSLEPYWFSTIYGVYFFGGTGLSAMAFLIAVSAFLVRRSPMDTLLAPRHFHDWGKLLLAFVLLWTYFGFSQFLIIWAGNLPEEIEWYLHRMSHGWQIVALALVLFHFAVPFALLLSRDLKKHPRRLAGLALFLLFMRWVDHLWQVAPTLHPEGLVIHWLDVAAPLAVGGLWLAAFVWLLRRHPVVPVNDPYLEEAAGHGAHH
ncbi:MAG TPA: hypothetical protein VHQ65_00850 [Thermoanaerobaculia bacterium]|nr:hypothetical protein [Thermoanaerobaculia bacterium]